MCRLYGLIANQPTKVECSLIRAQNALLSQSILDQRGTSNPDGWGIVSYKKGRPKADRHICSAEEDLRFSDRAKSVYGRIVLAHVRRATVGAVTKSNVHPFTHGVWTFAHNGTMTAFDEVAPLLTSQMDSRWARLRRGTTDSELIFLWILSRLDSRDSDWVRHGAPFDALLEVVGDAIQQMIEWARVKAPLEPSLNFLLTDGRNLVASRWGNSLYWIGRQGIRPCEVCDTCHCHHCVDEPVTGHSRLPIYRAVVVASEPITQEHWESVPDENLLGIDESLQTRLISI